MGWRVAAGILDVAGALAIAYPITGLRLGYWLWLASIGTAILATLVLGKRVASEISRP